MITAKPLFDAQFASATDAGVYTVPAGFRTIIDKFTVTNIDSSTHTITVNIVPSGQSVGNQNTITSAFTIAVGTAVELTELHNHILATGDVVSVTGSIANKLVIRASGREIT